MPKPLMPTVDVLYNVRPVRGVWDRKLLSCPPDGSRVDLWTQDDGTGRQRWKFTKVDGNDKLYHIEVFSGVTGTRKYLSCGADGRIDLWNTDDGTGRQRWELIPLMNNSFQIKVGGGTNPGETYLSCTPDGGTVDLYDQDDKSGRQQWELIPEDFEIDKVNFNLNKAVQFPKPDFISTQTVRNDTSVPQSGVKVIFERKAIETSSFQRENGFAFKVSAEAKVDVPFVGSADVAVETSTEHKWTFGTQESKEDTRSYELTVDVPPRSVVVAKATVTMIQTDIPYTAEGYSKTTGAEITSSGTWSGVSASEILYSIEQKDLRSVQPL